MANVLVVDDSSTVRNELGDFLTKNGFKVALAVDGMDGLAMAEKVRGELRNTSVNIVMLTTENSPTMKERGKAAGIRGWIVKPFNGAAVLNTFKTLAGV